MTTCIDVMMYQAALKDPRPIGVRYTWSAEEATSGRAGRSADRLTLAIGTAYVNALSVMIEESTAEALAYAIIGAIADRRRNLALLAPKAEEVQA